MLASIYIKPEGPSYLVCKDGRKLAGPYDNYFSAWMRREAERKAQR